MVNSLAVIFPILPILSCIAPITFSVAQTVQTTTTCGKFIAYDDLYYSSIGPNPQQRAENEGYTAETHEVTTKDGYILQIHRITGSPVSPKADNKTVVILLHGIMECSATWVIGSPQKSLGFILADNGYDVWLGNARGNRYARKHKTLTTQDKEYWSFSWHEIGFYDVPAMIDYALNVTKQEKLMYVGYSQGSTAFFVMASLRPEYKAKVEAMFALAPIAFMGHSTLPMLRILAPIAFEIKLVAYLIGAYEFKPSGKLQQEVAVDVCGDGTVTQDICMSGLVVLASPGEKLLNKTVVAEALKYDRAGSSIKQFVHYVQLVNSGRFCQYNHGPIENLKKYGSLLPPDYPVGNITVPIYLLHGNNDALGDVTDVEILCKKLPKCERFLVADSSFTHLDFVLSKPLDTLVNDVVTVVAEALQYDPAGASTGQLLHYAQLINNGRFCQYDHGLFENLKRYGSINLPDYPIERIKIPIYLHYGNNDAFVNVKDVDILYKKLPN